MPWYLRPNAGEYMLALGHDSLSIRCTTSAFSISFFDSLTHSLRNDWTMMILV